MTPSRGPHGARAGLAALGLTLLTALGLVAPLSPASASAVRDRHPSCVTSVQQARIAHGLARGGRSLDTPAYTNQQLRRIDRRLQRALAAKQSPRAAELRSAAPTTMTLRIPVDVHVIQGAGAKQTGPSRRQVRQQLRILNRGFAGGESAMNTPTPFTFYLKSFEKVRNANWYHASTYDFYDRQMRRRLHRGDAAELNLYFSKPVSHQGGQAVLGFSSLPWKVRHHLRLDGVTIHDETMVGGAFRGYNLGDTPVHEVGHWMGLFHTFEGGCSAKNDRVADTPAEGQPSFQCEEGRDTCLDLVGLDPIHNFMDYSFDSCMDRFTHDQVQRMADNWLAYRTP